MVSKKPKTKEDNFSINYFILLGTILLCFAILIPIFTFGPVVKAELNFQINKSKPLPTDIIPIDKDFSIIIPKINANAKVIKNVDPSNSREYQRALTQGVAHAKNSALPGEIGNTFIFAHSAGNWYEANQYNAVFYLLNKLTSGDEVDVYYQGQRYVYQVSESKIISANDTKYMEKPTLSPKLTLMTCWPPGTTLKRLIIIATPKGK